MIIEHFQSANAKYLTENMYYTTMKYVHAP